MLAYCKLVPQHLETALHRVQIKTIMLHDLEYSIVQASIRTILEYDKENKHEK
jgi:hypothetical protein